MDRRRLLAAAGTALCGGVAGCGSRGGTSDTERAPARSRTRRSERRPSATDDAEATTATGSDATAESPTDTTSTPVAVAPAALDGTPTVRVVPRVQWALLERVVGADGPVTRVTDGLPAYDEHAVRTTAHGAFFPQTRIDTVRIDATTYAFHGVAAAASRQRYWYDTVVDATAETTPLSALGPVAQSVVRRVLAGDARSPDDPVRDYYPIGLSHRLVGRVVAVDGERYRIRGWTTTPEWPAYGVAPAVYARYRLRPVDRAPAVQLTPPDASDGVVADLLPTGADDGPADGGGATGDSVRQPRLDTDDTGFLSWATLWAPPDEDRAESRDGPRVVR
ncbi:hypothetical protein RYH80_09970 [Halobaculum sp. MBLA0147]|uniref:hypothetical protein n=1 Tax=Halobaculum sp. MBLA0147 TaxID=3079934 RepID=UPI003524E687